MQDNNNTITGKITLETDSSMHPTRDTERKLTECVMAAARKFSERVTETLQVVKWRFSLASFSATLSTEPGVMPTWLAKAIVTDADDRTLYLDRLELRQMGHTDELVWRPSPMEAYVIEHGGDGAEQRTEKEFTLEEIMQSLFSDTVSKYNDCEPRTIDGTHMLTSLCASLSSTFERSALDAMALAGVRSVAYRYNGADCHMDIVDEGDSMELVLDRPGISQAFFLAELSEQEAALHAALELKEKKNGLGF